MPAAVQLKRVLFMVMKASPGWMCASLALMCAQAILPLAQLYFTKLTIDAITAAVAAPEKTAALPRIFFLIGITGASALAAVVFNSVARVVGQSQSQRVTDHVQDVIHAKSVALDLEYYENSRFHDTLHRAQQEAHYRPTRIVKGLAQVALSGATMVGIAALLFSCHWGVTVVLFASLVPGFLLRYKFAHTVYAWQRSRSSAEREAAYLNGLLTGEFYAREIRLFNTGPLLMKRFRDARRLLWREKTGMAFRHALVELAAEAGAAIAIFGSLVFIAHQTVYGAMTLGDMVMYYQAFVRGQGFLRDMLGGLADLHEDSLFLSDFFSFLDLQPAVREPRVAVPVPRPMKKGILFQNVAFRYPAGQSLVLSDVSMEIPAGRTVALVGANGSGKTTLVKLLCRLYDPTAGSIAIDGTDLRSFESTALRREIGIIFQDYARYQMTARENIWMGNVDLRPDDEKIISVARYTGAHEFLSALPRGYSTVLGKWFGDGIELSVGQWQSLALARAFLRDAQIFILDEPTSSMDARAEFAIFNNFRELAAGRTAILISHRFSTIRMADRIYVLHDGRIIEEGNHDDLIRRDGAYAVLFQTQARHYR